MNAFTLSVAAEHDLLSIFMQGLELFGRTQARNYAEDMEGKFSLLAEHPHLGRARNDIAPGVRTLPHEAHVIVYRVDPGVGVRILRVRHSRENWLVDPIGDRT